MSNRNHKVTKAETTTNLYELNKINMRQINPVDKQWLASKLLDVAEKVFSFGTDYWMLLCRERYDITIFNLQGTFSPQSKPAQLVQELITCFDNRGAVLDLTEREDGSYEIWIRDRATQENFAYYLFDYSQGVIEI